MTAETTKKQRWFQLRLTTCIVMMVVAAGLLFTNIRPKFQDIWIEEENSWDTSVLEPICDELIDQGRENEIPNKTKGKAGLIMGMGWPFSFKSFYEVNNDGEVVEWPLNIKNLMLNIVIFIAILAATAFGCEGLIRRRERKRRKGEG